MDEKYKNFRFSILITNLDEISKHVNKLSKNEFSIIDP
jgi:hypothetical protein